jgi:integrase
MGEEGTRDNPETESVPEDVVRQTLPFLHAMVAVMVQLQYMLGFRPRNVFFFRVGEVDRSRGDGLWYYTPGSYKTQNYVGLPVFPLGAAVQALLLPYLEGKKDGDPVFPYRDFVRRKTAKTPLFFYKDTYRHAILSGIKAARKAGVDVPDWTPYRLRNSAATVIALEHGIEAAQAQLVHRTVNQTMTYSDDQRERRKELAVIMVNKFSEK